MPNIDLDKQSATGAVLSGKIVFEFYGNEDSDFKNTSLKRIAKELRKEMNVSALPLHDTILDNPERGVLLLSFAASNETQSKEAKEKAMAYLDTHVPGRIVNEDWSGYEF